MAISIEITEEYDTIQDMVLALEEIIRRVQTGVWLSYYPNYQITGQEETVNEEEEED